MNDIVSTEMAVLEWPSLCIMYIVSITIISSSISSITIYINISPEQISSGNYLNIGDEPPYK